MDTTSLLRTHLEARLGPMLEHVRARPQTAGRAASEPPGGDDGRALRSLIDEAEEAIEKQVGALVGELIVRQAVLDSPRLALRWNLRLLFAERPEDSARRRLLDALLEVAHLQGQESGEPWPSDVSPTDLGDALRQTGDIDAQRLAVALDQGWFFSSGGRRATLPEPSPQASSTPGVEAVGQELERALERWPVPACALIVSVEKEVRTGSGILASTAAAARFAWQLVAELSREDAAASAKRRQIVTDALQKEAQDEAEAQLTGDPRAIEELDRELRLRIEDARGRVGFDGAPPADEEAASAAMDGILVWDARYASYLETFGEEGQRAAHAVREGASRRMALHRAEGDPPVATRPGALWALWADPHTAPMGCRFARTLTRVLWRERIRQKIQRERAKPPALVMSVHEPVVHLLSRLRDAQTSADGRLSIRLPNDVVVRVSAVEAGTINEIFVKRGIELFGSVTAHRLLRWQIYTGHRRYCQGEQDPRAITIEGGYSTLAHEILGLSSKNEDTKVRDIIEAQHACEIPLPPDGEHSRLLIRRFRTAVGRSKSMLELVLGTALLPNYVYELREAMKHSPDSARAQRLVPILELPPFVGRDNEHGAQATLSMLIVSYLRDNATDLVENGGALIEERTLHEMARRAVVQVGSLPRLLDRWTQDGPDGPAFLKTVGSQRYTLGDAHTLEREFIEEGGKRTIEGSKAGQKSVSNRRAKLKRQGR